MQGVQVFTGADDAWGGFCARYMERVRDEFGKCGIWVWGLEEGGSAGVQRVGIPFSYSIETLQHYEAKH